MAARVIRRVVLLAVVAVLGVALVSPVRLAALRSTGGLLIASDPLEKSDIGAMAESGEGGELEVADLYRAGMFPRVMLLVGEPGLADRELARRGVERVNPLVTTLVQLGVPRSAIFILEAGEGGTTDTTLALANWVRAHPARVIGIVAATHARRYRRTLLRVWPEGVPPPRITYPRMGYFRAEDWWQSRRSFRDGVFELQKLAWDYVRHPW